MKELADPGIRTAEESSIYMEDLVPVGHLDLWVTQILLAKTIEDKSRAKHT
jgi:hypothetical protein